MASANGGARPLPGTTASGWQRRAAGFQGRRDGGAISVQLASRRRCQAGIMVVRSAAPPKPLSVLTNVRQAFPPLQSRLAAFFPNWIGSFTANIQLQALLMCDLNVHMEI